MKKFVIKKYTKQDLQCGIVVISILDKNDNTGLTRLREILRDVFPTDKSEIYGGYNYYFSDAFNRGQYTCSDEYQIRPVVDVNKFYEDNYMENKEKVDAKKKLIGFKLKRLYPGCRHGVGYFEPYTTGEFLKWPEYWEPQYRVAEIVVNHNNGQTFTVTMNSTGFMFKGDDVPIKCLREILTNSTLGQSNGWKFEFSHIDIGCKKSIPLSEIKKLIDLFDGKNPLKSITSLLEDDI